ncbi:hypothetical protein DPMN_156087 [Dreissena polymorpha]|uniref:Uncharacterized protein n=1 Tax=Dreissena polymorpha TaxID=45954 RepID=A0A9D4FQL0_DREPO|nr:hypothetical protein DPMN_156087 [Dreissena polymorpha]
MIAIISRSTVTQSDETWQTCSPRWVTYAESAIWRLSAIASGESVAEGTLTGQYWPRYPIIGAYEVAIISRSSVTQSDETWQTCSPQIGSRMPKVQYGVSVPSLPVKVSPKVRYWPGIGPVTPL